MPQHEARPRPGATSRGRGAELPSPVAGLAGRTDGWLGDRLEHLVKARHRRRLQRTGNSAALEGDTTGPTWVDPSRVRRGNSLEVLIDGAEALPQVQEAILGARRSVHIAGWHCSPDFRLVHGPDSMTLRELLATTAQRVPVRVLMWGGPPLPVFKPTRADARASAAELMRGSAVECALDTREFTMHCHHEKLVVVDDEIAFVGGIDLTALAGDRLDSRAHPRLHTLGWHDAATVLRGPVVADVAAHFNARWGAVTGTVLPAPEPPAPAGDLDLELLRTVPEKVYDFLPQGEFSILAGYLAALRSARSHIYLENQFLWSPEVTDVLVDKLLRPPSEAFRLVLVLPRRPNNGSDTTRGQLARLIAADAGRGHLLATTMVGASRGGPGVYVHAKIGIVDDRWLTIGSANLNEHSLFNDTEVNILALDEALARDTRLRLWEEHTGRPQGDLSGAVADVVDTVWRPICDEQDEVSARGGEPIHRIEHLQALSRRVDLLQGPLRGLLVDG
ncbi:phospholipase D-like domain-containing protein [Pedococcus ginsenosidimutans]|uniref:phospholipase D-like domain-containing protein n=1 Tax=Pedococcus ginsenosidimutans TaxID=490570 RepID=UPI0031E6B5B0